MIGPGSGGGGPNPDERTPMMSSQLALRVAVVGSVALLMFAVIFLRLWFLQVLTGEAAVVHARGNIIRPVPVAAPRGSILAADGSVLVDSVKRPAVLVEPQELPVTLVASKTGVNDPAPDRVIYTRLARALGMSTKPISCQYTLYLADDAGKIVPTKFSSRLPEVPCIIAQHAADITTGTITVATNIPMAEQAYISERQARFTGVEVSQVSVSQYPDKGLAAQVLGTIGANYSATTKSHTLFGHVAPYDEVGQTGLEYEYNRYLQGKDGSQSVEVNAQGEYQGLSKPKAAVAGFNLQTSIDPALQRVGQNSLQESITKAGTNDGGAFVAMDPENGKVYAMGSLPTFDPNIFQKPLDQTQVTRLFGTASGDPELNRATQSVGPTGSTFKVVTATAALESGQWTPDENFNDTGQVCYSGECEHNSSGEGGAGPIDLAKAFEISDDDFFYHLGGIMNVANPLKQPQGGALQTWAKKFGIGQTPKIDLPYSVAGTLPTPNWVAKRITAEEDCDAGTGPYAYTDGHDNFSSTPETGYHKTPKRPAGYCGIAELPNAGWTIGDNVHMAVGQGDVQASPLQLATIYSAIANGGKLVTPHIGEQIQSSNGDVLARINPPTERNLDINPTNLDVIHQGLLEAATSPGGTSYDVMHSFKLPVYGKTGTAQYTGQPDYAWYAAYVPSSETTKPIVVVVWVEKGDFGDQTAAPVARQILNQWFYNTPGPYIGGSSTSGQGL